jgi:hypothetical protein
MNRVFADSHFFFAILNPHDAAHSKAIEAGRLHRGPLITTAWVLTVVAATTVSRQDREMC